MKEHKYCARCTRTLELDRFTKSVSRYDGLQPYCQECMKAYRIEYYNRNKPSHIERNKKSEARLREYVLEIKRGNCLDCSVSFPEEPWLMEFDHRDPYEKSGSIGKFIKNGSMRLLQEELDKCDLVCVICHRRRTARAFGWIDNRWRSLIV